MICLIKYIVLGAVIQLYILATDKEMGKWWLNILLWPVPLFKEAKNIYHLYRYWYLLYALIIAVIVLVYVI